MDIYLLGKNIFFFFQNQRIVAKLYIKKDKTNMILKRFLQIFDIYLKLLFSFINDFLMLLKISKKQKTKRYRDYSFYFKINKQSLIFSYSFHSLRNVSKVSFH